MIYIYLYLDVYNIHINHMLLRLLQQSGKLFHFKFGTNRHFLAQDIPRLVFPGRIFHKEHMLNLFQNMFHPKLRHSQFPPKKSWDIERIHQNSSEFSPLLPVFFAREWTPALLEFVGEVVPVIIALVLRRRNEIRWLSTRCTLVCTIMYVYIYINIYI